MCGEELVDVFEGVDEGLEFADDVICLLIPCEVVVNLDVEEFCDGFLFERGLVEGEVAVGVGVEHSVGGFGGVRNEVVAVEVGDELVEVFLCVFS